MNWGEIAHERFGRKFVIMQCRVDLSKDCFDLVGSVKHQNGIAQCN